jgi:chromosome segregation ATPase
LDARLTTAEGEIDVLQSDLVALEGQADLTETNLMLLDGRVTTAEGDIDSLEGRMTSAEGEIAGQGTRLTDAEADIVTLNNFMDDAGPRLTTAEGDIVSIEGRLDVIEGSGEGSVAKAEQDAKDYADAAVSAEQSARIAAVSAEQSARESADSALDARLDVLEGGATVEGSVAKAEQDAKDYTDTKIADLVNSAPAVLDTLKELADALGSDPNFATTVASNIAAETTAREAADSALDARIDALEADHYVFESEKYTLSSQDITNGYIDLAYTAEAKSVNAFVDRLAIHEGAGDDYTVSVVSGKTRMTFVNSLVSAGVEQLQAGDVIRVKYARRV